MTAFLDRPFTISAWGPSANFDLLRLNFDWLRDPGCCYFSVTACLFGFGVCVTFHPHIEPDPKDFDFDAWVSTTHVVVPTPEYDALVDDAEAWRREPQHGSVTTPKNLKPREPQESHGDLSDFGPNVPVEDLGGKPVYFEDGQPVYPGREKAP